MQPVIMLSVSSGYSLGDKLHLAWPTDHCIITYSLLLLMIWTATAFVCFYIRYNVLACKLQNYRIAC